MGLMIIRFLEKVNKGKVSFDNKSWDDVSVESKELIKKLLKYDYKTRISAADAKDDPWIVKYTKEKKLEMLNSDNNNTTEGSEKLKKPFENLRKFNAKQKLQQSTIAFLVRQVSNTDMVKNLRNIFQKLDENNDGTLSYDEIKEGFKRFYHDENIVEKEMEEILEKLDQDKSKIIEYEQFIRCTVDLESLLTEQNLKLAFQAFDKDNSGELSPEEIKSALGVVDSDIENAAIIKNIISEIDENGDGVISFPEFKDLMIKVMSSK